MSLPWVFYRHDQLHSQQGASWLKVPLSVDRTFFSIQHSPSQSKIVSVVFQGFSILLEVEVGVAQLAVDGTEGLQVFCAHLDGCLKKRRPAFKVSGLAQTFSFQSQLQAGRLHPERGFTNKNGKKATPQHLENVSLFVLLCLYFYFIIPE